MIYQQDRVRRSRPVALSAAAVASRQQGGEGLEVRQIMIPAPIMDCGL
jgi:hypothetical protein